MKRILTVACLLTLSALAANAEDYFRKYGNKPVKVINQSTDPASQEVLNLTGVDRGDLILKFENRPGEVGLPLDTEGLKLSIQFPDSVGVAYKQINKGEYAEAIEVLRPMVYPLVQYFEVPPENINSHEIIERYVFALVNSKGNDEEISELLRRIPLKKAPPIFSLHALHYVARLVEMGQQQDALKLLNRIPMDSDNPIMLELVMEFADDLREEGNLDEALFLYDRLQQTKGTEQAVLATLWSAYCNVVLERYQLAGIFVEKAGKFTAEDRPYSLAQLVKAKIELETLNYTAAMEEVAKGVVATDVSYNWSPELIYTTGLCYENLDFPDTAREVYHEIVLFYPESKWAKEAEGGLMRLPPPAPKEEAPGA
ncbi:tetratricopeptide repeat protein [Cerasicoccus arenae]|uniref:Tetratricopeptide repeat protein n=1 Tax=Cerasicoccus arenae TaxID=424488 RepID=A0A8J3DGL2_9BACT|nr:hypothetical protein [Cerasicoccus arenae]MBK1856749.1 hypothetical protein [Cerasicoccus arenae]GHB99254.1 hypothetical protein GCM10007047_14310 [Cerasicoccus arenae]